VWLGEQGRLKKVTRISLQEKIIQKNNKKNSRKQETLFAIHNNLTEYQCYCQEDLAVVIPEVIGVYYTYECEYTSTPPPPILSVKLGGGEELTPPEEDSLVEVPDEKYYWGASVLWGKWRWLEESFRLYYNTFNVQLKNVRKNLIKSWPQNIVELIAVFS